MTDEEIRKTLFDLKRDYEGFKKNVEELDGLVRGGESVMQPGVVGVLEDAHTMAKANTQSLARMKWSFFGFAAGGGLMGGGIVSFLTTVVGVG